MQNVPLFSKGAGWQIRRYETHVIPFFFIFLLLCEAEREGGGWGWGAFKSLDKKAKPQRCIKDTCKEKWSGTPRTEVHNTGGFRCARVKSLKESSLLIKKNLIGIEETSSLLSERTQHSHLLRTLNLKLLTCVHNEVFSHDELVSLMTRTTSAAKRKAPGAQRFPAGAVVDQPPSICIQSPRVPV